MAIQNTSTSFNQEDLSAEAGLASEKESLGPNKSEVNCQEEQARRRRFLSGLMYSTLTHWLDDCSEGLSISHYSYLKKKHADSGQEKLGGQVIGENSGKDLCVLDKGSLCQVESAPCVGPSSAGAWTGKDGREPLASTSSVMPVDCGHCSASGQHGSGCECVGSGESSLEAPGRPWSLQRGFCKALLASDDGSDTSNSRKNKKLVRSSLNEGEVDAMALHGIPQWPLYRELAAAVHEWMAMGHYPCNLVSLMHLTEQNYWRNREIVARKIPGFSSSIIEAMAAAREIHVQNPWLNHLACRKKVVEGRCASDDYRNLKRGQLLLFSGCLLLQVEDVRQYRTFREMIEAEGLSKVLPGVASLDGGVDVYRQFYTEDMELAGVVAIEVSPPWHVLEAVGDLLQVLGEDGICRLLRMRQTVGSLLNALPPSRRQLLDAFLVQGNPASKLTAGARALSKHSQRCTGGFFFSCGDVYKGKEEDKNAVALAMVMKILDECVWMNVHHLPHQLPVFEVRVEEGYGARWSADGESFRGFLEPSMEDGHERKWRH